MRVYARPTVVGQCSSIYASWAGAKKGCVQVYLAMASDGCSLCGLPYSHRCITPGNLTRRDTRRICGHGRMIRHFSFFFIYGTSRSQKSRREFKCYLLPSDGYMLSPIEVQYNESFDPGGWNWPQRHLCWSHQAVAVRGSGKQYFAILHRHNLTTQTFLLMCSTPSGTARIILVLSPLNKQRPMTLSA